MNSFVQYSERTHLSHRCNSRPLHYCCYSQFPPTGISWLPQNPSERFAQKLHAESASSIASSRRRNQSNARACKLSTDSHRKIYTQIQHWNRQSRKKEEKACYFRVLTDQQTLDSLQVSSGRQMRFFSAETNLESLAHALRLRSRPVPLRRMKLVHGSRSGRLRSKLLEYQRRHAHPAVWELEPASLDGICPHPGGELIVVFILLLL